MAACPECGSTHISSTTQRTVNWGRAIGGLLLFGPVGGAVGSLTGEGKHAVLCVDCGKVWYPSSLRHSLTTIEKQTGKSLNLEREEDRNYLRDFVLQIEPVIMKGAAAEKRARGLEKLADSISKNAISETTIQVNAQNLASQTFAAWGTGLGLGISLLLLIFGLLPRDLEGMVLAAVLIIPLWLAGSTVDTISSKKTKSFKKRVSSNERVLLESRSNILRKAASHRANAEMIRKQAEEEYTKKLREFMSTRT
jgi:hypothetical protein